MYAVVEVGAKQYNVKKDDIIEVEKLEKKEGEAFSFEKVLLISDGEKVSVGTPYLTKGEGSAEVLGNQQRHQRPFYSQAA